MYIECNVECILNVFPQNKEELENNVANINNKKKAVKQKVFAEGEPGPSKRKNPSNKTKIVKEAEYVSESSESDVNVELDDDFDMNCSSKNIDDKNAECMFCLRLFSMDRKGEKWIRYCKCFRWEHEECSNSNKKKNVYL